MPSQESVKIRRTLVKDQLDDTPISQKRKAWDDFAKSVPLPVGVFVSEAVIEERLCLWFRTANTFDQQVIIYIHGGGLTEGSVYTAQEFTARLALVTQIPVLSVNYRLAPEHPYPAALNDMKLVYHSLLTGGFQPKQIVFGADSSGCNLALTTLISMRDESIPLPSANFLISPSVDLTLSGDSIRTRAALDPMVSEEVLAHCAKLYAQDHALDSPKVSALFGDLSGLPNTLIQVGDHEILLSDSIRLHENLQQAGGQSTLKIWEEMWHVWHYFPQLPEADKAVNEIKDFLYQALDLGVDLPKPAEESYRR